MEIEKLKEYRDLYERYINLNETKEILEGGYVSFVRLSSGVSGDFNINPDIFENTDIRKVLLEAINGEIETTDTIIELL